MKISDLIGILQNEDGNKEVMIWKDKIGKVPVEEVWSKADVVLLMEKNG
jgi:hypothetical protein